MANVLILGVDYGKKRTGLAIADEGTGLALPLRTVEAGSPAEAAAKVAEAAAAEAADLIVVGLPVRLSGGEGGEARRAAEAFIAELKAAVRVEIETEDERLTTDLVERERREAGIKKGSFDKDAAAAAALLDTYLVRRSKPLANGQ